MSDHNCGDPNCSGLHGSLADLITAYERKDSPFEDDTPAQNVLRRTFPIPVVVACGALVAIKVLGFIEELATADSAKDAAELLREFLQSKDIHQLGDFAETMLLVRHAWDHCRMKEDGGVEIDGPEELLDDLNSLFDDHRESITDEAFIEDFKRRMN